MNRPVPVICRRRLVVVLAMAFVGLCCGTPSPPPEPNAELIAANNRGVALMGRFDFEGARQVFAELVDDNPDNPDLRVNLAIAILNRQNDGDEIAARAILDEVLVMDQDHLRAKYCRGLLLLHAGDSEAAYDDFRAVAETDSSDSDAVYFVGQSLMQLERFDEALSWFDRALDYDPHLRSAYYRAFQALQRLGRTDDAEPYIERFQALEGNPRARLMEFKYTRMGRLAEVQVIGGGDRERSTPPIGEVFAKPRLMNSTQDGALDSEAGGRVNLTGCDLDGDGNLDLFFAGVGGPIENESNLMLRATDDGFVPISNHPLARVSAINAALWGDIDNDGRNDVYLCRRGPNQLWLQTELGEWREVAAEVGVAGAGSDTVDGALFDADHDGDLDLFVVNADADNELFNNNRDGSFRPLAAGSGLTGNGQIPRAVMVADLDGDLDADLIVVNHRPPHQVLANQLMWNYEPAQGWEEFANTEIQASVVADVDADGSMDVITLEGNGDVRRWSENEHGVRTAGHVLSNAESVGTADPRLEIGDVDGDGSLDLLITSGGGWSLHSIADRRVMASGNRSLPAAGLFALTTDQGPSLVGWAPTEGSLIWDPGPGRFDFVALRLSGLDDDGSGMRSNASGIGTRISARIGSRWTVLHAYRTNSGPGQSLQPMLVGLGGAKSVDFVAIDWTDAVLQTEMALEPGGIQTIVETQRQMSSCPVVFTWDGERFAFVTDLLGVGGMGYAVGPGEYAEPRPWENLMLPAGLAKARDGRIIVKLTEPMEEAAYLDAVRLVAYDVPPGWFMTLDERMPILGVQPTGRPILYRRFAEPARAMNERGVDVSAALVAADHRAAPVGELDRRFVGRLRGEHILTLEFDEALNWLGRRLVLVADGWVEYPYSSTSFAAWQAGADYRAPTLEARGADGRWSVVLDQFGYPAGMPRQMSMPLPRLPAGTTALRLRSNQEVYWDRVVVVAAETTEEVIRRDLMLESAKVEQVGFARRETGAERLPIYDHDRRVPLWDSRVQPGFYTRFGDALDLVAVADDALAIFGPGEGLHLEFAAPPEAPQEGWTRVLVLEAEGWCKDMDLYTRDGATLEPVPKAGRARSTTGMLDQSYNHRWNGG